jgi:sugar phosphate isomerase/epimerase
VFWDDLDGATREAMDLGFDAIEIFPPAGAAISNLKSQIRIAAVGTGAGWVKHQLTFTSLESDVRNRAIEFAGAIVDAAGQLGAPAIIGSMQGRWGGAIQREEAMKHLAEALSQLAARAQRHGVMLIYEPLNRYETNLINTLRQGLDFLRLLASRNIRLLADLFHMNIEEENLGNALRGGSTVLGHVHLADSNRRPTGFGHTDFNEVAHALRDAQYDGYVSAECLPWPDSAQAAQATIDAFNKYFR